MRVILDFHLTVVDFWSNVIFRRMHFNKIFICEINVASSKNHWYKTCIRQTFWKHISIFHMMHNYTCPVDLQVVVYSIYKSHLSVSNDRMIREIWYQHISQIMMDHLVIYCKDTGGPWVAFRKLSSIFFLFWINSCSYILTIL